MSAPEKAGQRSRRETLSGFTLVAHRLAGEGSSELGPEAVVAVFEFVAKALEQEARAKGSWSEPHAAEYRGTHAQALANRSRRRAAGQAS